MRKRRLLIALLFALGVLLVPVMAYADVSEVSPVNPHGKEVVIIKAYDLDAVIVKGQHLKLDAACGVAVSGSVNWSSSNESVATVASNGEVIGVADGTAKITAECSGITDTLKVTVKTPKYVMTWSNTYGSEYTYEYNAFGLQTRCVSDYGTDETYYNNYGLPTERRENRSYGDLRTTYTYDSLMNVTKEKNSDGEEATYKYDSFGRLTSFTDTVDGANDGATYDYENTKSGGIKVTETKWDLDDPSDKEVETYIYNKKGLLIKHTDDYVDTYKYDKKGRLIVMKTTSYGGVTEQVSYNKQGLEAKWVSTPYWSDVSRFDKCVETNTYDSQKRLVKSIRKYGSLKKITTRTYQGNQDIPVKQVEKWFRKEGGKYESTSTESSNYVVEAL